MIRSKKPKGSRSYVAVLVVLLLAAALLAACGKGNGNTSTNGNSSDGQTQEGITDPVTAPAEGDASGDAKSPAADTGKDGEDATSNSENRVSEPVTETGDHQDSAAEPDQAAAANPESMAVLVNKEFALPEDYTPQDLVYPDVPFTFKDKIEKRMMRKEAATALEEMFAGAKKDGIYLAGVSAYRSHKTQTTLFNRYVKKDGEEKAKTYSAVPGHSEHETGLAIDVSASDGRCAAEDCFGETKEAKWLADHVSEYGFIIRYPEGKDAITGYKYEPWHLRYVGKEIAADIAKRGITLEEYYNAVPVAK